MLGISVDSVFSHRAFAEKLGGIDFPLLADFHPKGDVTKQYGLWRDKVGVGTRAIIIVDPEGIVRHSEVFVKALPDVEEVLSAVKLLS